MKPDGLPRAEVLSLLREEREAWKEEANRWPAGAPGRIYPDATVKSLDRLARRMGRLKADAE